jgi:hypothetical protein
MANTISTAFVEQFKSNLIHLAEQQGSRLRSTITEQSVTGEKFHFERIGNVAAVQKTTRHTATPVLDVPHSRRTGDMNDYQWADMIDKEDRVRMLIEPKNAYAKAGANAMGHAYDDLIIAAATGNATSGAGASIALPAGQKIAAGSTGLTLAKLLNAREIMDAADIDPDEDRFMIVTAKQVSDLLNTTEVKSADYNTVKALASGQVDTFMGFKFIRSQRLALSSGTRSCIAYTPSGIGLGVGADIVTKIDELPTTSYATQVYLAFTAGATRIEDEKVVKVDCAE